jgi:hypothetical protein
MVTMIRLALPLVALAAACVPDVDVDTAIVDAPRILAVRSIPAEVRPGDPVRFEALVAGPVDAPLPTPAWTACLARKPLAETGPVASGCLEGSGELTPVVGEGSGVDLVVPGDACRRFGSEPPVTLPDQPPGRPVPANGSGGFELPVVVRLEDDTSVASARLTCGAYGATRDQVSELAGRSRPNLAPIIESVSARGAALLDEPLVVEAGETIELSLAWPGCPTEDRCGDLVCGPDETTDDCASDCTTPAGCGGAERYVTFDPRTNDLVTRRESLSVAWFATDGSFDQPRLGRAEADTATAVTTAWTAPSVTGPVRAWAVLRDARGGTSWRALAFEVVAPP